MLELEFVIKLIGLTKSMLYRFTWDIYLKSKLKIQKSSDYAILKNTGLNGLTFLIKTDESIWKVI